MSIHSEAGFTLVEMMIVVLFLGIIAALVMPDFHEYPDFTKRSSLYTDLHILRTAIECYYLQHDGRFPGNLNAATNWTLFIDQLTKASDRIGNPGIRYGPYLRDEIPRNPYNKLNTGKVGNFPAGPDGTTGWYYNPFTGEIRPNHDGAPWGPLEEIATMSVEKDAGDMKAQSL